MWVQADGSKQEGDGCNTVQNQKALGFYLGDDCLQDFKLNAPNLPMQLDKLQKGGLMIEGKKINVELLLGGDLKFITALMGLTNNASLFPCPFCITHKYLLGESLEELEKKTMEAALTSSQKVVDKAMQEIEDIDKDTGLTKPQKKTMKAHIRKTINETKKAAPVVYLGPRTVEQQQMLAHMRACECCPGAKSGQELTADGPRKDPERTATEVALNTQHHFSTKEGEGPYLWMILVCNIIADVLHIVLRVVPVIYRATVSRHVHPAEQASIAQWVFDYKGVLVSSSTALQSKSGTSNTMGTESWPGNTCDAIITLYEDLMGMVHVVESQNHRDAMECWETFIMYNEEVIHGCKDDNDPTCRQQHSQTLQKLANNFIMAYKKASGSSTCTPYMHVMQIDLPRMALRFGNLMKYSSQGVERLHQWVKFLAQFRSNRKAGQVEGTVIKQLTMQGNFEFSNAGKRKVNEIGHMSKADMEAKKANIAKVVAKQQAGTVAGAGAGA